MSIWSGNHKKTPQYKCKSVSKVRNPSSKQSVQNVMTCKDPSHFLFSGFVYCYLQNPFSSSYCQHTECILLFTNRKGSCSGWHAEYGPSSLHDMISNVTSDDAICDVMCNNK